MLTGCEGRILVLEDDKEMAKFLVDQLRQYRYFATTEPDGKNGLEKIISQKPDLVLLDLNLPTIDGLAILQLLGRYHKELFAQVLFMVLSGNSLQQVKTAAFQAGASDYITKPFNHIDLLNRVQAKIRLKHLIEGKTIREKHQLGENITVDIAGRRVWKDGKLLELKKFQFDVLALFIKMRGHVLSQEYIFNQVWGRNSTTKPKVVFVVICELRKKIEDNPQSPQLIQTVSLAGYRLSED